MSFLVIPAIDLIDGQCVRLHRGRYGEQTTYGADPAEQAQLFQAAGFSRLHVVDLQGARVGKGLNRERISEIIQAVDIPVQVGGGIRDREDVRELLSLGARHLILGTVVLEQPEVFEDWLRTWGPELFILSLDFKHGQLRSRGWLHRPVVAVEALLERIENWKITQVICTDVDRDGTMSQPGYDTLRELRSRLGESIGLIAAGGVSRPEHISRLRQIQMMGAVVGRALYEGSYSPEDFARAG